MKKNKTLSVIFLTIFLDMMGIGILIPVFPLLINHASEFCVTPSGWTQGESYIMSGWLLASYPICQFIMSPILGQLSDRYGRKKILIISIFGTAISYVLFGFAILSKSITGLFIARMIDGLSGGNISIAQAVIGDVSQPEKRARNFGLIGVSIGVGFIMGPAIGGILSDPSIYHLFDAATPFWLAAILGFINCWLIARNFDETLRFVKNSQIKITKSIINIQQIFKLGKLKYIIFVMFLYNFGWSFFTAFWGIILAQKFAYTQVQIGFFFAYLGVMIVIAQGGVVRRLSGKVSEIPVLKVALLVSGLSLGAYYVTPVTDTSYIYWVTPILAIGSALVKSFSSSLITRLADKRRLGEVMGVNSSSNALSQVFPMLCAGYIAYFNVYSTVLFGCIFVLLSWVLFQLFNHKFGLTTVT
jgi:DHA1 family tetracycline resistance protein-like MFS transporter